ncbi:hypothetical protein [Bifidobacterium sp. ESL0704]|uniref:hypothetical protein n=1 Tax=Bifidobacterium sp. ESL0704 TaxID=2983219 RepID=UPI0023F7C594|nr:hypothetical protein [Bifidobacterium sp. ESL0704]WEV52851.1 hypothetical protein OZX64_08355 [Bifidobacterium sp. ESL0704]
MRIVKSSCAERRHPQPADVNDRARRCGIRPSSHDRIPQTDRLKPSPPDQRIQPCRLEPIAADHISRTIVSEPIAVGSFTSAPTPQAPTTGTATDFSKWMQQRQREYGIIVI